MVSSLPLLISPTSGAIIFFNGESACLRFPPCADHMTIIRLVRRDRCHCP